MAANKFTLGSLVYLTSSAGIGFLESFKILGLRQGSDGLWYYKFGVPQRPPTAVGTLGDRITKKQSYDFELCESEVLVLCDALVLAEGYLQNQLTKIQAIKAQYCDIGTGTA